MILKDSSNLDEKIIKILANSPGTSVEELHKYILKSGQDLTKRAIYKTVKKLLTSKILIKVGSNYSLRLSWAVELRNFADDIFRNYRKKSLFYSIIPKDSKPLIWNFPDPALADDFWRQICLSLFERSGHKNMFYWIRHAWFQMPSIKEELKFQSILRKQGNKIYIIVEGNTFLDHEECKNWPSNPYIISFAPSPFKNETLGSLSVIGDYIVTIKIDNFIRSQINNLFAKVKSSKDIQINEVNRLFQLKGKCSLKLEHNSLKAKKLTGKFSRYFGVKNLD